MDNTRRAGHSNRAIGKRSKRIWSMSRRRSPLLVGDIWERLKRSNAMYPVWITMRLCEMRRRLTRLCEISKSSGRPHRLPEDFRKQYPEIKWPQIIGLRHRIVHDYFISTLGLYGRLSKPTCRFSNPGLHQPANLETKNLRLSHEDYLKLKVVLEPTFCRHPLSSRVASGQSL
jgi:hypothetical protein